MALLFIKKYNQQKIKNRLKSIYKNILKLLLILKIKIIKIYCYYLSKS